ncbi:MAG: hypothetical protein AAF990_12560 [Bacteroidota bacterium]
MKKQLKFLLVIAIQIVSMSTTFAQEQEAYGVKPGLTTTKAKEARHNAIKVRFMSPVFGHLGFSYEHITKPNQSYELDLGFIGISTSPEVNGNETGAYFGLGYKLMSSPDFGGDKARTHALQGWYLKPQVMLSTFTRRNSEFASEKGSVFSGALLVNGGKQWVFGGRIVLDIFAGLGFGFTTEGERFIGTQNYSYTLLEESNLALTTGIKLGFAF